jgi:hypothetical protein
MRSHLLRELDIDGREAVLAVEPMLDLYRAERVLALNMAFHVDLRGGQGSDATGATCVDNSGPSGR